MNNSLRITSGEYRGRKIATPGGGTHPMGERERLALFNMLAGRLSGASVLDAYAGSGALGLEALSRGAREVVFVEKNRVAAQTIQKNCNTLGVEDERVEIITDSVADFCADGGCKPVVARGFDIILADPPYDKVDYKEIDELVQRLLGRDGVLVLSHPGEAQELAGLVLDKSRKYAGATISVYVKSDSSLD